MTVVIIISTDHCMIIYCRNGSRSVGMCAELADTGE